MCSSCSTHPGCSQQEAPIGSYTHAETMCSSCSTHPRCSQQEAPTLGVYCSCYTLSLCVCVAFHWGFLLTKWEATCTQRQCVAAAVHTQGPMGSYTQAETMRSSCSTHTGCSQQEAPMGSYTQAETMCSSCSTHPGCSQQEAQLEKRYTFTKSLEPEKSEIQFIATAILKRLHEGHEGCCCANSISAIL